MLTRGWGNGRDPASKSSAIARGAARGEGSNLDGLGRGDALADEGGGGEHGGHGVVFVRGATACVRLCATNPRFNNTAGRCGRSASSAGPPIASIALRARHAISPHLRARAPRGWRPVEVVAEAAAAAAAIRVAAARASSVAVAAVADLAAAPPPPRRLDLRVTRRMRSRRSSSRARSRSATRSAPRRRRRVRPPMRPSSSASARIRRLARRNFAAPRRRAPPSAR